MAHLLVETLQSPSGEQERESTYNGPVYETVAARLEQVGCFRDDSVGANQSAQAMVLQAGSADVAAPTSHVAGMAGTIVGLVVQAETTTTHGAISAGSMTFQATIGGVNAGDAAVLSDTVESKVAMFSTPVAYAALDLLGITLASSSLSPTSSRARAWLLVRHGAGPMVDASGGAGAV